MLDSTDRKEASKRCTNLTMFAVSLLYSERNHVNDASMLTKNNKVFKVQIQSCIFANILTRKSYKDYKFTSEISQGVCLRLCKIACIDKQLFIDIRNELFLLIVDLYNLYNHNNGNTFLKQNEIA